MNASLSFAHAINIIKKSVIISWRTWVETITECDFTNTCHVNTDMQVLVLIKSNIIQFLFFTEFSNNNFIRIKIISKKKLLFMINYKQQSNFRKLFQNFQRFKKILTTLSTYYKNCEWRFYSKKMQKFSFLQKYIH